MYKDKVCFVTGGSRGIGFATVKMLLEQGAKVCFLSHFEETGKKAMDELLAINADYKDRLMTAHPLISSPAEMKAVADEVSAKWGPINCVFANAGVDCNKPITRITEEMWDSVMDVNLKGVFVTIQACVPSMKEGFKATGVGGAIVCTSSVTGTQGSGMGLPYPASKAGIIGIVRSLSMELSRFAIRVNAVCPGCIDTDLTRNMPELARKQTEGTIPLWGRLGYAEEIASALVYMNSDEASYVTGDIMEVTGGYKSTVGKM